MEKLPINSRAPYFCLNDVNDQPIDLEAFQGRKLLIGFFRHAGCPFCNLRVHNLVAIQDELKQLGLDMVFFFESDRAVLQASALHQNITSVPLIPDPTKDQFDAYGLESSGRKVTLGHITSFVQTTLQAKLSKLPVHLMKGSESFKTLPAEFLVDESGVIRELHYSQQLTDRIDLGLVREFAQRETVPL
ncbi:MAG: redoxin domain-containing protein [Tunicatimonas sp.]